MKGLKRSLCYWGYIMEKYFLTMSFIVVAMSVMMGLTSGKTGVEMASTYIPVVGMIAVLAQAASSANYNMPQSLSFGATRKESMIGMQIFIHVMILQILLVMLLTANYLPNPTELTTVELFKIYAVLFVFGCGAGNGVCAVMLRFGNKVGTWIYIIFMVLFIFLAMGIMASGMRDLRNTLLSFSSWGVLAAIIMDAIMIVCCFKAIQKYEVRV